MNFDKINQLINFYLINIKDILNTYNVNLITFIFCSVLILAWGFKVFKMLVGSGQLNNDFNVIINKLKSIERNHGVQGKTVNYISNIFNDSRFLKHSWIEFKESLVSTNDGLVSTFQNTIDAHAFFQHEVIYRKANLHSRLPSLLTGAGILGTFIGIVLGLQNLHLEQMLSAESDLSGIQLFLTGIATSFYTSIIGLGLALSYNLCESTQAEKVERNLDKLTFHIDRIFQRTTNEQKLHAIHQVAIDQLAALQQLPAEISQGVSQGFAGALVTDTIDSSLQESVKSGFSEVSVSIRNFLEYQKGFSDTLTNINEKLGKTTSILDSLGKIFEDTIISTEEINSGLSKSKNSISDLNDTVVNNVQMLKTGMDTQQASVKDMKIAAVAIKNISNVMEPQAELVMSKNSQIIEGIEKAAFGFQENLNTLHNKSTENLNSLHKSIDQHVADILKIIKQNTSEISDISRVSTDALHNAIVSFSKELEVLQSYEKENVEIKESA